MSKIGIDARFWGIEHTGIGRYVMELVRNLEKIDNQNQYIIFLRDKYYQKLKFTNKNFTKAKADFTPYSFSEQLFFNRILEQESLDLIHFPHFNYPILYRGKFIVTIHDLIKHESKGTLTSTKSPFFYWFKYLSYLLVVNLALKRAKIVIVPSYWWLKKIMRKYYLPKQKIKVTYESVSKIFKKENNYPNNERTIYLKNKYGLKTPFVIYTGNLYPHKNILCLAEAIKSINQERKLYLVIVCAKSIFWQRFRKEIEKLGVTNRIILAGFVSDEDLVNLYQLAEIFVFPSLLEGFGLPGLEAMALGLPVVAARSSCLPEVYHKAALFFNPKSSRDLKHKILMVLDSQKLKRDLILSGKKRIRSFSWLKMAQETLSLYNQVLKNE